MMNPASPAAGLPGWAGNILHLLRQFIAVVVASCYKGGWPLEQAMVRADCRQGGKSLFLPGPHRGYSVKGIFFGNSGGASATGVTIAGGGALTIGTDGTTMYSGMGASASARMSFSGAARSRAPAPGTSTRPPIGTATESAPIHPLE